MGCKHVSWHGTTRPEARISHAFSELSLGFLWLSFRFRKRGFARHAPETSKKKNRMNCGTRKLLLGMNGIFSKFPTVSLLYHSRKALALQGDPLKGWRMGHMGSTATIAQPNLIKFHLHAWPNSNGKSNAEMKIALNHFRQHTHTLADSFSLLSPYIYIVCTYRKCNWWCCQSIWLLHATFFGPK